MREASERELNVQIERLTRAVRAARGNMIAVQHFPNHGVPTHSVAVTFRIPLESSLSFDDKLPEADIHSQPVSNIGLHQVLYTDLVLIAPEEMLEALRENMPDCLVRACGYEAKTTDIPDHSLRELADHVRHILYF